VRIAAIPAGVYCGDPAPPCWLIGSPVSWIAAQTGSRAGSDWQATDGSWPGEEPGQGDGLPERLAGFEHGRRRA
jgi:hypothetical protein